MPENPLEGALKAPGAIAGWAKARPFVFVLLVVVTALLAIKFSDRIVGLLRRSRFTRWMVPAAAAPVAMLVAAALGAVLGG